MDDRPLQSHFSDQERRAVDVLVIEPERWTRAALRAALLSLRYGGVSDAPDHAAGLDKLSVRRFSHVIFEAGRTNMDASEFLTRALEMDPRLVAVAASSRPSADDVFGLILGGGRGYLVKPATGGSLDEALAMATFAAPVPDLLLYAKDRNLALAALALTALDRVAAARRDAASYETARRELVRAELALRRAVDLGRTFAVGGDEELREAIITVGIERGNGPATRLGRTRKRLREQKRRAQSPG